MLVEVTQEHINQGVAGNYESCPIALAMQDNGLKRVVVTHVYIFYDQKLSQFQLYTRVYLEIDSAIREWMKDFDGGKKVFPIQIETNKDEQYATLVE